jgi:hypothetical protein
MKNDWQSIPNYKNYYEINSDGIVRSIKRKIIQTHPRNSTIKQIRYIKSRIKIPFIDKQGYVYIILSKHGKTKKYSISRLVLTVFCRLPKLHEEACHYPDPNKSNNNINNLIWGLPKINAQHKKLHGTYYIGNNHPNSKLSQEEVINILKLSKIKSLKDINDIYHWISKSQLHRIIQGTRWTHIKRD